jgi:hypothetical protein
LEPLALFLADLPDPDAFSHHHLPEQQRCLSGLVL